MKQLEYLISNDLAEFLLEIDMDIRGQSLNF